MRAPGTFPEDNARSLAGGIRHRQLRVLHAERRVLVDILITTGESQYKIMCVWMKQTWRKGFAGRWQMCDYEDVALTTEP